MLRSVCLAVLSLAGCLEEDDYDDEPDGYSLTVAITSEQTVDRIVVRDGTLRRTTPAPVSPSMLARGIVESETAIVLTAQDHATTFATPTTAFEYVTLIDYGYDDPEPRARLSRRAARRRGLDQHQRGRHQHRSQGAADAASRRRRRARHLGHR